MIFHFSTINLKITGKEVFDNGNQEICLEYDPEGGCGGGYGDSGCAGSSCDDDVMPSTGCVKIHFFGAPFYYLIL